MEEGSISPHNQEEERKSGLSSGCSTVQLSEDSGGELSAPKTKIRRTIDSSDSDDDNSPVVSSLACYTLLLSGRGCGLCCIIQFCPLASAELCSLYLYSARVGFSVKISLVRLAGEMSVL